MAIDRTTLTPSRAKDIADELVASSRAWAESDVWETTVDPDNPPWDRVPTATQLTEAGEIKEAFTDCFAGFWEAYGDLLVCAARLTYVPDAPDDRDGLLDLPSRHRFDSFAAARIEQFTSNSLPLASFEENIIGYVNNCFNRLQRSFEDCRRHARRARDLQLQLKGLAREIDEESADLRVDEQ